MNLVFLLSGIALLYLGGEALVRGAARIGQRFGLSPMVIGLTLVSVGTSCPELAATLAAIFKDAPAISFGNVIGSNIANLGLVLGLTAMIWPLEVAARFIYREVPLMIAISAAVFLLVMNEEIGRLEGIILLVGLLAYIRSLLRSEEGPEVEAEFSSAYAGPRTSAWKSLLAIVLGIGLLVCGAHLLVNGAVGMARLLGISERVIGLTMVALGTSLPELASCTVAAFHREGDIVLGNLIGSNVFNILFILGTTAVVRPLSVGLHTVWPDLMAMMFVSGMTWLFLRSGRTLRRVEGVMLLAFYFGYVTYLFV